MPSKKVNRIQRIAPVIGLLILGGITSSFAAGTWEATLHARDINGDGTVDAYFDTALGISWLADVDFGTGGTFQSFTWPESSAWASNLNVYGITGWRLPSARPLTGSWNLSTISYDGSTDRGQALPGIGWGTASELGHMFYVTLGNTGCGESCDYTIPAKNTSGPFINLKATIPSDYNTFWTNVQPNAPLFNGGALYFNMSLGFQSAQEPSAYLRRGWAVIDGDVPNLPFIPEVPEPSNIVLLLAGLAVVAIRMNRRRGTEADLHTYISEYECHATTTRYSY